MWMVAVLAVATLAGCAAPDVASSDDATFDDFDVAATAVTGIIRGVVVDEAVVPVEGVAIALNTGPETETNSNGAFAFDDLEPGAYFLQASKQGWAPVQAAATVEAGVDAPPVVKIVMARDPSQDPFVVPLEHTGYILCSTSIIALCGAVELVADTDDEFIFRQVVDTPHVTYVQGEMQWESTQALSENMYLWQEAVCKPDVACGGEHSCSFDNPHGPSPIVINNTLGDYDRYGDRDCFLSIGNQTDLQYRIFSGSVDETMPPFPDQCYPPPVGVCWGVGMALEQEYTVFTHLFYQFKPSEGWVFVHNGSPEVPDT